MTTQPQPCSVCSGVGLCETCGGEGESYQPPPPAWATPERDPSYFMPPPKCRTCNGSGMCPACQGAGLKERTPP